MQKEVKEVHKSGLRECGTALRSPREGTVVLRCFSWRALYNLTRVQSVAGLTARLPDPHKDLGEGLPFHRGRGRFPVMGREIPLPRAGSMGAQMPPAGSVGTLKRRGINSPAPEPIRFG